jgi:hypothetical protein
VVADLNVGNTRTNRRDPTEALVSNDCWRWRAPEEASHEEEIMQI